MTRNWLVARCAAFVVLLCSAVFGAESGLVADYSFAENSGDMLIDRSGNENNGQITGASWVPNGQAWALEFDGVDDCVDCGTEPSAALRDALTIEAWIYAEPIHSVFLQVPIVGTGRHYLTQWVYEVCAYGNGFANDYLPFRRWTHVAMTSDGSGPQNRLKLYVDGNLVVIRRGKREGWQHYFFPHDDSLIIAGPRRQNDAEPPEYARRFKGKLAGLKLYSRALTQDEVRQDMRSTNVTGSVAVMPVPLPGIGKLKVELSAATLGTPLKDPQIEVGVYPAAPKDAQPLASATVSALDDLGRAVVDLDVPQMQRGGYRVRATAKDKEGHAIGTAGEEPLAWPGSAQFPSGPEGARKLNNLVTELLAVAGPEDPGKEHAFVNPRPGFIYICNRTAQQVKITPESGGQPIELTLANDYGDAFEAMRYLPAGRYAISAPAATDLRVRAVAETYYDYANTEAPYVKKFGPYAGEFEKKYVFPHYTTFWVGEQDIDKPFVKELRAKGRRMLEGISGSSVTQQEGQSRVDAICQTLLERMPGFTNPNYDGFAYDETSISSDELRDWAVALDRILSQPKFQGKTFHVWNYAIADLVSYGGGDPGRELVAALKKYDCPIQWEAYLKYYRREIDAWRAINDKLIGELAEADQASPGFVQNLIVVPYAYVTGGPPWMSWAQPAANPNAYLEMQIRTIATHPAYQGVRGLGIYRSPYADEETTRWVARLMRHYAIEGHTEPLGSDPYVLNHIQNPEFEQLGAGWDLKPATEGSIRFDVVQGFGDQQGRYPRVTQGDTVLVTERSAKAPNVFSQEIRNLEPGRLYAFRMFSADRNDMSSPHPHAINIQFDNAELVPEKSFTHVGLARASSKDWLNWHIRVFRAKASTATMRVSDWAGDAQPGGPIGQQLMYNFIVVKPYFSE